jgi:hypothetical protein
MGQHATRKELAEYLLDEPRQAAAVASVRDFSEEGLQVLPDDGVEHGVVGVAGLIRAMEMRHALGVARPARCANAQRWIHRGVVDVRRWNRRGRRGVTSRAF